MDYITEKFKMSCLEFHSIIVKIILLQEENWKYVVYAQTVKNIST